mgnify:CR=1 FL=1
MKKSLVALAFGTMGLGIAEFGMMSVLSVVAKGLDVSVSEAGHFVSSYALGVCAGAPALVFLAQGRPLKKLLIMLMILMCFGNFMAVIAPNYGFMLAARFVSGLPHGGFFGVAGIVAKKLAPPDKQVEAMADFCQSCRYSDNFIYYAYCNLAYAVCACCRVGNIHGLCCWQMDSRRRARFFR